MIVRAVRGATTVESNTAEQIIKETTVLLEKIITTNNINEDDIISVIFTVTNDLNAAFPAEAARKAGLTKIALMCMREIDVPGSLKNCIRILMHINTEKSNDQIKHIYLKGSKSLRQDITGES